MIDRGAILIGLQGSVGGRQDNIAALGDHRGGQRIVPQATAAIHRSGAGGYVGNAH